LSVFLLGIHPSSLPRFCCLDVDSVVVCHQSPDL
jgi:hypothetical protein